MGASVKQGLSEILKYNLVSFVYSGGFLEVSPSMLSLLGYSEKQLKNLKLEDIIDNYENTFLLSVIEQDSYLTNSGSVYGEVRFMDAVGYLVEGTLKIEWQGKGDTKIFGYFYPHNGICAEDKTSAVKKISDLSVSLYFEIDKNFNIIEADQSFYFYFDFERKPKDLNLKSIKQLEELYEFLSSNSEGDYFSFTCGSDQILAVFNRFYEQTDIRLYSKEYLIYPRFPYSLPSVQSRRIIWDGVLMAILIDPEKRVIVEANKSASDFYGYSIEEIRGMPVSNIFVLPLDVQTQELEMAVLGVKKFFIFRNRTADGTIKDIRATMSPVELFGKTYIFAFISDITRRKSLEKIIEDKNRSLTELNMGLSEMIRREVELRKKQEQLLMRQNTLVAMGEMVSALAHTWRQPLNTIGLIMQQLEDEYSNSDYAYSNISESAVKVKSLLNGMSSSIDSFRELFKPSTEKDFFDVKSAVESVIHLMKVQLDNHRINIALSCTFCDENYDVKGCKQGKLTVLGYCNEFKQVIFNIFTNFLEAVKLQRANNPLIQNVSGMINVKIERCEQYISLTFEDNRCSLGDSVPVKTVEPYLISKSDSFGSGIYITKAFMKFSMNGSINNETYENGSRFIIKVPFRERPVI